MNLDPVELTKTLLAYNTTNPPGNEREAMEYLGGILQEAMFQVHLVDYHSPQRKQLVARFHSSGKRPAIAFTGHLDTMPVDESEWSRNPFGKERENGLLYGRGASDMKGGIAAMVVAAIMAAKSSRDSDIILIVTADEEYGCFGAQKLVYPVPPSFFPTHNVGLLVVGEPTSNEPFWGHKGVLWLRGVCTGKAAHGSIPDKGDNAIYKAADAVMALKRYQDECVLKPMFGRPTLNVGIFHGGTNINSVPDRATFEVDVRSVPGSGWSHEKIREELTACVGNAVHHWETITDLAGVRSGPQNPWLLPINNIVSDVTNKSFGTDERIAFYFTDASMLIPAMGDVPVVILGPGELSQAHVIDEWCSIQAIEQATKIYTEILRL